MLSLKWSICPMLDRHSPLWSWLIMPSLTSIVIDFCSRLPRQGRWKFSTQGLTLKSTPVIAYVSAAGQICKSVGSFSELFLKCANQDQLNSKAACTYQISEQCYCHFTWGKGNQFPFPQVALQLSPTCIWGRLIGLFVPVWGEDCTLNNDSLH